MSGEYGLLVVGGGPAGLAAARAYRAADGGGRVAIVTDEHALPYNRPPLTKRLLREDAPIADLEIESEQWFDDRRVELIGGRAVTLDSSEQTVTLSGGRVLSYETCLLSTGAEPKRLAIPGVDHPRVGVMRSVEDLRRLRELLTDGAEVIVVGSGFIACEVAASLALRGHPVELVSDESAPNITRLGTDAADAIVGWLSAAGVALTFDSPVEQIVHEHGRCLVRAGSGQLTGDVVVIGAGVAPRAELAGAAGLMLVDGAIPVDARMRTGVAGLLGAGDVARAHNRAAGRALRVEHWGDALGQGEIAGQTAAGVDVEWDAVPGFWSTIGNETLKYVAWGDGFDDLAFERHARDAFTVRYGAGGRLVGVLTHNADADYEQAYEQIAGGMAWSA